MRSIYASSSLVLIALCVLHGCTEPTSADDAVDASESAYSGDCERYGWYGDGICDICAKPDPDCGAPDAGGKPAKPAKPAKPVTPDSGVKPPSPAPWSDDPFDPTSCPGSALTRDQAIAKLGAGGTVTELGSYTLMRRTRSCTQATGCGPWGAPTPTLYPTKAGDSLDGVAVLRAGPGFQVAFLDRSLGIVPTSATSNSSVSFNAISKAEPLSFSTDDDYHFHRPKVEGEYDELRLLGALFTVTITSSCARIHGTPFPPGRQYTMDLKATETEEYAALVRF